MNNTNGVQILDELIGSKNFCAFLNLKNLFIVGLNIGFSFYKN